MLNSFFTGICKYFTYSVTFTESFLDLWLLQVAMLHVVRVHCYVWHTRFRAMAMPPVVLSIFFVMTWRYKLQIIQDGYNLLSAKVPCALFIDIPALVCTAVVNNSFSATKLVTTCFLHSPREF